MEKSIGAIVGLLAFQTVIAVGLFSRSAPVDTLLRALLALVGGFFIGWLLFGNIGVLILRGNLITREEEKKTP